MNSSEPAASFHFLGFDERVWRAFFVGAATLLVVKLFFTPWFVSSDWIEYTSVLRALATRLSPAVWQQDAPVALGDYGMFVRSPVTGQMYGCHFWIYPLFCVPFYWLLQLCGRDGMAAFQVVNGLLLSAALYAVLFKCQIPFRHRLVLAGLCVATPTFRFLFWVGPEVWSWSWTMLSVVMVLNRRFVAASVMAALAAMQNPPLMFWAFWIVAATLSQKDKRTTTLAACGAMLCFAPNLFSLLLFRTPNLIALVGGADVGLISRARTASFFFDLNQGMIVYLPFLVLLALGKTWQMLREREWPAVAAAFCVLAMIMSCQVAPNWNSATIGVMRYAIWMQPVLAWMVLQKFTVSGKRLWWYGFAIAMQLLITVFDTSQYRFHNTLARVVLSHAPQWYNPDPEIFVDRTLHVDTNASDYRKWLPAAFVNDQGFVTKVLITKQTLPKLSDKFNVDARYLKTITQIPKDETESFYLHPPHNAISPRPRTLTAPTKQ